MYFVTHVPTDAELQTCKHILMTNDSEWDPHIINMGHKAPHGDLKSNSTLFVKSLIREQIKRGRAHETNVVLGSVSNALVTSKPLERLIEAVNIWSVKPVSKYKLQVRGAEPSSRSYQIHGTQ